MEFKPYPAETKLQRQRSLHAVEELHHNAARLLSDINQRQTIFVSYNFHAYLVDLVDTYAAEIHRLKSVKFNNKGVSVK